MELVANGEYMRKEDWDRLAEVQRIYDGKLPLVAPRME